MRAAQSQALGSQRRLYLSPLWMFAWLSRVLCEEVGRNVSHPAETDEEIHALPEALIASEGPPGL